MIIFKSYGEANDALISGDVDFVRFGPASYVIAKDRDPGISLLAMEHKDGEKRFGGVIVVRTNSTIRELSDLKGSRFAFGDEELTMILGNIHCGGKSVGDAPGIGIGIGVPFRNAYR